jgi:hypothetical protein
MYLDGLESKQDIADQFEIDMSELEGCHILFAVYKNESYEGSALVIYSKDGKLYEATGSHCSCNGLEGQWSPEETSIEALKMRDLKYYGFEKDAESLLVDLVFEREVLEKV